MNLLFVELEGWERSILEERLPGHTLVALNGLLQPTQPELHEADVLSVFINSRVTPEVLAAAPRLKLVTTRSTGFDHVDLAALASRNIPLANVPEYGSNTVAEHTFALLLALARKLMPTYTRTQTGQFATTGLRGFDLRGKTLGVVGTGNIGLHVIRIARSFGMRVLAFDPFPRQSLASVLDFEYVAFDDLLAQADVLSLHAPATPANHHLIRAETLAKMKRGAVLINTARGSLVNTRDLLASLQSGHLRGAGLDVVDGELAIGEDMEVQKSLGRDQLLAAIEAHRLMAREDVIVTPHNAFNSEEAVRRILETTIANIQQFIATGKPVHPVKA